MQVALEISRTANLRLPSHRRRPDLYRLFARIQFQTRNGWGGNHLAIVDTGAPYSLIPASLASSLKAKILIETPIRGIVPEAHVRLEARLARIRCRLFDDRKSSPLLSLWAMLAKTDHVPLILGWAGCLDRAKLTLDGRRGAAWIEF